MTLAVGPHPSHPGPLFEAVAEAMWSLKILAEIGERQAALGDLVGLSYSLRRITATTRFAVASGADLRELAERQHRETDGTETPSNSIGARP